MKTAIIGPGAMGSLFATYLTKGGLDVVLVDHLPERATGLDASGIAVEGVRGAHRVAVKVLADASLVGPVDVVIVCVKAFHTEQALRQHRALVGPSSVVLSIQNGVGNIEAMTRAVPADRVVGGSTTLGANLLDVGRVHHAGDGETFIGELDGSGSRRIEALAEDLSAGGIQTQVSDDIQRVIWTKLLVNVGINALTAILRVRNGVLPERESSLALMRAAVTEAVQLADARGMAFDLEPVLQRVEEVARRTAHNRSSMLADVLADRPTEIDFINGAIARMGDAPVNATLTRLVQALEQTVEARQDPAPAAS